MPNLTVAGLLYHAPWSAQTVWPDIWSQELTVAAFGKMTL